MDRLMADNVKYYDIHRADGPRRIFHHAPDVFKENKQSNI
ncbi:hypothetical protein KsCSTR_01990 [Candidatus Kuenenia stuttgartiensis]|uniref:Uncharacterized protein n=1 Tax=Kuenenia stuttgartiensis TaxID=174633 RepID=A0A2C9CFM7_KUEST|nr:hypothetical protein KsCSTR_01990 [Candidatus Kuenenia stuttgartiensis]SOH04490.1 hypothetical protein KSMBR1_1992 [Candidatus Kuenenia stuttgartiensis]